MVQELLKQSLKTWIDNIDAGTCDMSEEDMLKVIENIKELNDNNKYMSKYQAFNYLGISRATFDNLIKEGKLPKGIKKVGFNELFWNKRDLDKAVKCY